MAKSRYLHKVNNMVRAVEAESPGVSGIDHFSVQSKLAVLNGEAAANAEIRGFLRRETGEDWAHISVAIADRENIDLGDVPAFLRERTTVTWRDA